MPAGFLGLFPPFVVFHPPAAMDRRTIENPFLTRDVFLVRCPSPHGPSVLPLLRLMRLGAWRSLAIFCAFFLMLLPCFLSLFLSCSPSPSSRASWMRSPSARSFPSPHLCPTGWGPHPWSGAPSWSLASSSAGGCGWWLSCLNPGVSSGGGAWSPWRTAWP